MGQNMTETVITVSDEAKNRLWKTLDDMSDKLQTIEKQLSEVVRLEERVNFHDESLQRHTVTIERLSERARRLEMWQASHRETSYDDAMLDNMRGNIKTNSKRILGIESKDSEYKGQKDVAKEILKWISVILSGIVLYYVTKK